MGKDSKVKKLDTMDKAEIAKNNRRKRRAERNRIRTIKHIHKLLDQVVEGIGDGFNHHGWCNAAAALKQTTIFLEPQEYQAIGNTWSTLYVGDGSTNEQLISVVNRIKERIAGSLFEMLD